ncbi:anti-sigma factor domain-containing protein [Bacillus sp. B15-48]|uniref:anti-sigma factor domain-containing protein n=1 Tax=Bacillus sp. B15-48 TaxID=1548601 RepID=UPI00193EF38B|nr:anti-sigma factor domain-containing protein [Bacillus sp. B15-48]MBM4764310.1 anti-sigma factor domain-containing protein [Bacillus sp. B15-48]
MRKGVVLEVNERYVTLLTPEGEYIQTRKLQQEYLVGEEIQFFPSEEPELTRAANIVQSLRKLKVRFVSVSVAVLLLVMMSFSIYDSRHVYAYMSIDINPSIELGLNKELKVISMQGYNDDGKKIAAQLENWKNKNAVIVAEKIIEKMETLGFLNENKNILIAAVPTSSVERSTQDGNLEETLSEIKNTTQEDVEITVVNGTVEERETAIKQGMTTGGFKQEMKSETTKIIEKTKETPVFKENEQKNKSEQAVPNRGNNTEKGNNGNGNKTNLNPSNKNENKGKKESNSKGQENNRGKESTLDRNERNNKQNNEVNERKNVNGKSQENREQSNQNNEENKPKHNVSNNGQGQGQGKGKGNEK